MLDFHEKGFSPRLPIVTLSSGSAVVLRSQGMPNFQWVRSLGPISGGSVLLRGGECSEKNCLAGISHFLDNRARPHKNREASTMSKSYAPKDAARKRRGTRRKATSKVIAEKARDKHQQTRPKVMAERNSLPAIAVWELGDAHRGIAAQFEKFCDTQAPDTMREFAERSVAQTREVYEHSKNTLQSVLESWRNSFGTTGQGVTALNQKIIDMAERNIDTSFDLAMDLCRAKNLAEVMELQTAYWQKQFGELKTLADEVRRRSAKTRVGAGVARRT